MSEVQFFSTGCTLLDLALGGGWACGHVFNIVGDKSTGKTLLAIEAFANFRSKFKDEAKMRYAEAEAAFDIEFAKTLGFPVSVSRPEELISTVEDFADDLSDFMKKGGPALYILDSLDALSDNAELERFQEDQKLRLANKPPKESGSYGVGKPKAMSKMFRLIVRDAQNANCAIGVISQIRDKIGVTFGETKTRSGGHALDFYSSQILWLAETGKKAITIRGETRPIGVDVHGKVKKCKVGMPSREADFRILFGYGVDDETSMLDWLSTLSGKKVMAPETIKELRKKLEIARDKQDYTTMKEVREVLAIDTIKIWKELEADFAPSIKKYGEQ